MSQFSDKRAVSSLASLYIIRMLGLFMVLPVITVSGQHYQGSSEYLLAIALGIYGLTQACLQVPFGVLSDRLGRKPLIAVGLVLFASGSWIAATASSIEGLIIGRALQGAGAIAGVVMAMVGDLTSEQNRSKAMASIGASIGLAFALSLVLGPYITELFGSIRALFWLSLVLSIAGLFVLFFWVPKPPVVVAKQPMLAGLSQVLGNKDLLRLNACVFILHALLMMVFVIVPPLLEEQLLILKKQQAWLYLKVLFVAFIIMVPMMIIAERRGRVKLMMVISLTLKLGAVLLLALVEPSYWSVVIAILLFFIGFNYFEASLPSLMTKIVPPAIKGAGSGVFSTCQFLGAACGAIGGGWVIKQYGVEAVYGAACVLLVLWLLTLIKLTIPKRKTAKVTQ